MGPGVSFQAKRLGKELLKVCLRCHGRFMERDTPERLLAVVQACSPFDRLQTNKLASSKIKESLPAGIVLVSAEDLETWYLDIQVLDANPLYLDKTFRLSFKFGDQYPIGMNPYNIPFPY